MKQIVFSIIFSTFFVEFNVVAHNDNPVIPLLSQIRIKENPGETLEYIGKIGSDFDSALDSLRRLKGISSEMGKEPLEVIFDYDGRLFYGIVNGDCRNYSDVLDTKGNYYLRTWFCSNENDVDIPEESIFNQNSTFTIDNSCEKIVYHSRIGNDFDSALDSLIRKYEPILNTLAKEGHYSGEGFNIDKKKINVDFSYDDRYFILLSFTDKKNIYQILFSGEVIDEKGNYFIFVACEDEPQTIWTLKARGQSSQKRISYDLNGRRLMKAPEKGLYIQDGKKVLVK